jgi:hypothetical protein
MALTKNEKAIALSMQADGKSVREIMGALAAQRTNRYVPADNFTGAPSDPKTDFAIGAAKGAGQLLKDTGDLAQNLIPGARLPGIGPIIDRAADAYQDTIGLSEENLQPDNAIQKVGSFSAQGAAFLSPFVAGRLATLTSRATSAAAKAAENATIGGKIKSGVQSVVEFAKNPRLSLAKNSVEPQLEASANRIYLEGTKRLDDPLAAYEADLAQSKKALEDIKVDPAIATVGEEIGDAFKEVVAKRRAIGATMSDELKKVADIETDVSNVMETLRADLAEEGLAYVSSDKTIKKTVKQTKMAADDLRLLEKYAVELNRLGQNPTIKELDAFLSRIPSEIDVYKASKNLIGTTNGERIIKKSLSQLRQQFDPTTTGNTALESYAAARREYASLTSFIEEGERFLGKLTQSGDFAKDASLAKSSVQSILNQGKKDWLEELEKQTGYPALDRSVIALQAMKDAGDFRGLSLLQQLSDGAGSPLGFPEKVIKYAMDKVARAAVGTPEEQTRIFLQALKEAPKN